MANFEAQVRTSYRDVRGLVLSCTRADVVEETKNPGFVREWLNQAPGLPSKPAIRNPGDAAPTYLGGRFSNPKNTTLATQPTLGSGGGVEFVRANSSFLVTEFIGEAFPDSTPGNQLACGYQFTAGTDVTVNQVIFSTDPGAEFVLERLDAAGDAVLTANGLDVTVAGDHADGTFVYTGEAAGTATWEIDGGAYGTGFAAAPNQIPSATRLFLGADGSGNFLDGTLDSIHIWAGELSPLTIDLIWQTINQDGTDFSTQTRAPFNNVVWTDITGDSTLDQFDRLRPQTGFPHRFYLATLPSSPPLTRVQVAASVDGMVLPDSALGGDLFDFRFIEFPGPPFVTPVLNQDLDGDPTKSWTSVADFDLRAEGHYTLEVTRPDGGSIILHFDVEVG